MRVTILAAIIGLAFAASTLAATKGGSGQCRDSKGSFVTCGQGAAATDSEGVPLAAKASVIRNATARQTSAVLAVVPGDATAKCADGTYSSRKRRGDACRHDGGVATWIR